MSDINEHGSTDAIKTINKALNEQDPIIRNVEKVDDSEGLSPMDPPDAMDANVPDQVNYEELHPYIQKLIDEHENCKKKIDAFEQTLNEFRENGFNLNDEINTSLSEFFQFFDNNILDHNQREEKELFPILNDKLLSSGEHSEGKDPNTAIDLMEDDHIKFIQLATLAFNMLGLASRLPDPHSRTLVYDVAYNNGKELVELLRLHIFREDSVLFPLAHQLIEKDEFSAIMNQAK